MQVGTLVKLKNLHRDWGKVGLIVYITSRGQIGIFSNGSRRAIPWWKRNDYLEVLCK